MNKEEDPQREPSGVFGFEVQYDKKVKCWGGEILGLPGCYFVADSKEEIPAAAHASIIAWYQAAALLEKQTGRTAVVTIPPTGKEISQEGITSGVVEIPKEAIEKAIQEGRERGKGIWGKQQS